MKHKQRRQGPKNAHGKRFNDMQYFGTNNELTARDRANIDALCRIHDLFYSLNVRLVLDEEN